MALINLGNREVPDARLNTYKILQELRTMSDAIVNVSNTPDGHTKAFKLQKLKTDSDVLRSQLPKFRGV